LLQRCLPDPDFWEDFTPKKAKQSCQLDPDIAYVAPNTTPLTIFLLAKKEQFHKLKAREDAWYQGMFHWIETGELPDVQTQAKWILTNSTSYSLEETSGILIKTFTKKSKLKPKVPLGTIEASFPWDLVYIDL
jgi:hypothetical protein